MFVKTHVCTVKMPNRMSRKHPSSLLMQSHIIFQSVLYEHIICLRFLTAGRTKLNLRTKEIAKITVSNNYQKTVCRYKRKNKTFNHVPFQLIFYPIGSSFDIQKCRFYHLNPPEMATQLHDIHTNCLMNHK